MILLPRRVTRSVLLSGLLLAALLVLYLLPQVRYDARSGRRPSSPYSPIEHVVKDQELPSPPHSHPQSQLLSQSEPRPHRQDVDQDRKLGPDHPDHDHDHDRVLDMPPPSFDWSTVEFFHKIDGLDKPLPTEPPRRLPRIQARPEAFVPAPAQSETRREAVRAAFKRSYDAYRKHAWMRDELKPVSGGARDTFGGWAATLVDSLDTLWIMGFRGSEWDEAVAAIAKTIDWSRAGDDSLRAANMFETTIRHLGGLLSAYDLSADPRLLRKAIELGEMLLHGFDTPNGMPPFWLDFAKARSGKLVAGTGDASASPASLSLEFTRLSQITGDARFYAATDRVTRLLERLQNTTALPGMWPRDINFRDGSADDATFTLGAGADSLYEYLPKMHALLGGADPVYETLFSAAMDTAVRSLFFRPVLPPDPDPDANTHGHGQAQPHADVLFSGEYAYGSLTTSSQHLTCFVGGMFALGGRLFLRDDHLSLAARLSRGCAWAYRQFATGIMPEVFTMTACDSIDPLAPCPWDEDLWRKQAAAADPDAAAAGTLPRGFVRIRDQSYLLRPEAIESVFIMYRVTGDEEWLDAAWAMFQGIMNATTTDLANSAISDVTTSGETTKTNSMESFWLAETLKYFYLIFSPPDVISLDEWVFNTEAHPFKRPHAA